MKKCFENEFALIEYNEAHQVLMLTWHRFVKEDNFRNTISKFYDLSEEKNAKKWFFDSRKQSLVAPNDQKWTVEEINRRKFDTTTIKTAVVMPASLFMEVAVHKISRDIEEQQSGENRPAQSEYFQQFKEVDEALGWLHQ